MVDRSESGAGKCFILAAKPELMPQQIRHVAGRVIHPHVRVSFRHAA